MKIVKQIAGIMAAVMLLANVAVAEEGTKATTYKVDASKSTLKWNGKKVTGEHFGTINLKSGSFTLDGLKLTGGSFEADMNSIVVEDLTDKVYNAKLVGHLKSDDFFSVEKNPTASFAMTKAVAKSGGVYDVSGNLTIKGITKPITFPVTVTPSMSGASVKGTMVVDRAKYDMKFRSKSFFDAATLGDNLVYDDFTIEVNLVATK